jgi:hypothetical protein
MEVIWGLGFFNLIISHCLVKREKKRRGDILVEGKERKGKGI